MGKSLCFILLSVLLLACQKNPVDSKDANSPGEEQILFVQYYEGGVSQLCTMKPDGTNRRVISEIVQHITPSDVHYGMLGAVWSPDKSKILFIGGHSTSLEQVPLWILNPNNGEILYQIAEDGGNGVWAPDGSQIMFARRVGFGSLINDLYRIDSDGSHETLFFHDDSLSIWPWDWSPDGQKLLVGTIRYYTDEGSLRSRHNTGIFDLHTQRIQYIFHDGEPVLSKAQWTSNQDEIMYVHGSDTEPYNIYFFNLKDSTYVNVTVSVDLEDFSRLAVSPDNSKIAFAKPRYSANDIYVLDINSQSITNITNIASDSIRYTVMNWR